jgi:hypothetical protein
MFSVFVLLVVLRNIILALSKKVKLSRYRPELAHGRSGRLRPRIFLTFGTRRW